MRNSWQFEAIGTTWNITSSQPITPPVKKQIAAFIERFDLAFSRFRADSTVRRMAQKADTYRFASELGFEQLFGLYQQLYQRTNGKVTPLVAASLEALGYDANYQLSAQSETVVPQKLNEVVEYTGGHSIRMLQPALLDFGAAGKGLLVDCIAKQLLDNHYDEFLINASGDILHRGKKAVTVGLEHPNDPTKVIGTLPLHNQALCGSAINRRAWGDAHHVIDGLSGNPTRDIVASWVVAETALVADGLATAIFFVDDPEALSQEYSADYLRISKSGILTMNRDMKARVTLFS